LQITGNRLQIVNGAVCQIILTENKNVTNEDKEKV
jgi:hypothetical protein